MSYVLIGNRENDLKFCWFGYVTPVTLFVLGWNKTSCRMLLGCKVWIRFSRLILLYNNGSPEPIPILYIPNKLVYVTKYQAISVSFLAFQASARVVDLQWSTMCFRKGSAQGICTIYKSLFLNSFDLASFCSRSLRYKGQRLEAIGVGERVLSFPVSL